MVELEILAKYHMWKHLSKVSRTAARWPGIFCGFTKINWDDNEAILIDFYTMFHSLYFTRSLNKANYMYISSFGLSKCLPCGPNAFVSI